MSKVKRTKNGTRKKSGWARTKTYPSERHPARYQRTGKDSIKYLTFTHSSKVIISGIEENTIELQYNIDPNDTRKSYVYPRTHTGKRSALGAEVSNFRIHDDDYKNVIALYESLPVESVPTTGGVGQYKKRGRKRPKK